MWTFVKDATEFKLDVVNGQNRIETERGICSQITHGSDDGWTRWSGRATILPKFGGSGQHFDILVCH